MINSSSPVAMYYQLKEILAKNISEGKWPAQTQMMSERQLCEEYRVSRVTARKAVELLTKEGYVYTLKGKGTFVKGRYIEQPLTHFYSFREDLRRRGVETASRMLGFEIVRAGGDLASSLGTEAEAELFRIERIFLAGQLPYAREISYIPRSLCPELGEDMVRENGLYNSLKVYNIIPTRAREQLKAILLDSQTAGYLNVKENDAAIYLTRITYSGDVAVEKNVSYVRGDMFVYSVELQNP